MRNSNNSPICIAELQLIWHDASSDSKLASARLYFKPENTPFGRLSIHGKVIFLLKIIILMNFIFDLSSAIFIRLLLTNLSFSENCLLKILFCSGGVLILGNRLYKMILNFNLQLCGLQKFTI